VILTWNSPVQKTRIRRGREKYQAINFPLSKSRVKSRSKSRFEVCSSTYKTATHSRIIIIIIIITTITIIYIARLTAPTRTEKQRNSEKIGGSVPGQPFKNGDRAGLLERTV